MTDTVTPTVDPFDLIDTPWIPVIRVDGTTEELGLRELFARAHELREIRDPIPTVEFGLYRLLAALTLDIFALKPGDVHEWGEMFQRGRWDMDRVNGYFAKHARLFQLFDPERPFLQTGGSDHGEAKPLAALLPAIPSGTNALHFHHAREEAFAVSPAAAARLLTMIAPFMTAGGAGLAPSINGAPPWYVLMTGGSLFETICLNTPVVEITQATGSAPPAWRNFTPLQSERRTDASMPEALTWRPRRIRLIPGTGGVCSVTGRSSDVLVRCMNFSAGESVDFEWYDPSIPYIRTDKGRTPMRPREGRAVWRDSGPLAFLKEDTHGGDVKVSFTRPLLVDQFGAMVGHTYLPKPTELRLTAYGMRTDMKMKVFEWTRESLALPSALVWNGEMQREARQAMRQADEVAFSLKRAIKLCYPRDGGGNKAALDWLIGYAERAYWNALHGAYDHFLYAIADAGEARDAARAAWADDIKHAGRECLEEAIDDLDTDDDALKRWALARSYFKKRLTIVFSPPGESVGKIRGRAKSKAVTTVEQEEESANDE